VSARALRFNSARSHPPTAPLRVESLDATRWKLLSDFTRTARDGRPFVVKAGDTTDFASVPWWSQSLLPKTGTWTKASVAHDKRCDLLNAVHRGGSGAKRYFGWNQRCGCVPPVYSSCLTPPAGWFNAVDTDRIFREDAIDDGTDVVRAELLWLGVRLGALANPARREGWLSTAPRVLADLVAVLAVLAALVAGASWGWPW
jgi:hypothetical protein